MYAAGSGSGDEAMDEVEPSRSGSCLPTAAVMSATRLSPICGQRAPPDDGRGTDAKRSVTRQDGGGDGRGERWRAKRAVGTAAAAGRGFARVCVCVWKQLIMADKRAATEAVGGRAQML